MRELTLLLGTNLGDRQANLDEALERLDKAFGGRRLRASKVLETEAIGFSGPNFLNMTVVYSSRRSPESVLKLCKRIERAMGRKDAPEYTADGSRIYHDRIIDIDILFYGDLRLSTPLLTIPHPQVESRPFVGILLEQTYSLADANRRCKY
jgi:2-amino-4-hydroxy-6-hydroxymethyldihydropteridine diphosphokinase